MNLDIWKKFHAPVTGKSGSLVTLRHNPAIVFVVFIFIKFYVDIYEINQYGQWFH